MDKEIITLKWVDYRPSEDVKDQVYVWASFDSKGREIFRKEVSSYLWMRLHAHSDYEARIIYEKLFPKGFIIKKDLDHEEQDK